ncbi:MAG: DUF1015 family protein [Gammaproteobacteria bacterium]|nr:DUF1015 domain-containing protein [Rhodocyclaceae bacterium]MBU3908836.1 DUF1015 family protein [Gammaproteobacteria bacterium]MBU3987703.1 DUF1015 family protein [Gammaproteobacteria bacterium]MBU4003671.1 DUF1015 family protein [Gammaproteobacteria bacterium]MBU4021785.1 DUF1015 family protein [Gammaproteobacteria bacterium]
MVTLIKPFRGLRPAPGRAAEVAAPPYDVLSTDEARLRAAGKPWSFLHVSRPEIDLAADINPYDPSVYAKAAENIDAMLAAGVLKRDSAPCYYAYRLTLHTPAGKHEQTAHVQTGLVATASVACYSNNRIKKHEFTRPDKEDDRVRQIEATNAQTGPVLLAYPASATADALIDAIAQGKAAADVTADDGIRHQIWVLDDAERVDAITRCFDGMEALYIADGHHRSAAAARVAAARRQEDHEMPSDYFLSVLFPHHEMMILDYNRVVRDLHGMEKSALVGRLGETFTVEESKQRVKPAQPGEFGMYLAGQWYKLTIKAELIPADPVARLDVSLLSDHLLGPLLGITDLRRDKRIEFVGGIRGLGELERRVNSGEMAVAFALHPTRMDQLMAVADSNQVMPPKSTWFEPKLADGLVSHVLD